MSEEALQIVEERREVKGRGEREKYIPLNAEFQRIARRDKKALLSEQCKETEETIECERLETSDLRYQRNLSCKDHHNKGQKRWT